MLHIKDIEAFARINEALADESDKTKDSGETTAIDATTHPAMLLALVATGRLPLSALPKAEPGSGMTLPWARPPRKP